MWNICPFVWVGSSGALSLPQIDVVWAVAPVAAQQGGPRASSHPPKTLRLLSQDCGDDSERTRTSWGEGGLLEEAPEVLWLALSGKTEWLCREIPAVTGQGFPLQLCGDLQVGQSSSLDKPPSE